MTTVDPTVRTPPPRELADHLSDIQATLKQQRQFRVEQLAELTEAAANAPPPSVDDVHGQVNEILRTGAQMALTDVEDALARVRAGRYGLCERCAAAIALERLEILPMSRYCMPCQHAVQAPGAGPTTTRRSE